MSANPRTRRHGEERTSGERKMCYLATSSDGRRYVGTTKQSLETRRAQHERDAHEGRGALFQQAIRHFGPEEFTWERAMVRKPAPAVAQGTWGQFARLSGIDPLGFMSNSRTENQRVTVVPCKRGGPPGSAGILPA